MRLKSCIFLLGVVSVYQFRVLPPATCLIPVLALFFIFYRFRIIQYGIWFALGFSLALVSSIYLHSKYLEPELEGIDIYVSGYVNSLPTKFDRFLRFNLDVIELRDIDNVIRRNPENIRLYWYAPFPDIKPGDYLNLVVRIKRPHGFSNPGGFDYEAWLFKEKIRATGYVRELNTANSVKKPRFTIHLFRFNIRDKLSQIKGEYDHASSLAKALILGDRGKLSYHDSEILAVTGTSHLLAISGLHIGLVASFMFFIVRWLWPLPWSGAYKFQAQYVASIFSIVSALIYALLAGFTVPTQRALIMLSIVLLHVLTSRKISKSNLLATALIIVLVIDPLAVLSSGFWLSFLAVSIIIFTLNVNIASTSFYKTRKWFRVQIYINLALLPILALMFNQFPVISIFANIIAIPWVSIVTMPILLLGTMLLYINLDMASVVIQVGFHSINIIWNYLEFLAGFNFLHLTLPTPSTWVVIAATMGLMLMLIPYSRPGLFISSLWLLPLFYPVKNLPHYGDFEVVVLDVGQGLSMVVRTQNRILLYDTGPGSSTGFNTGLSVVIPYLKHTGFNRLDMIIQSHGDNDHIGGLEEIIKRIEVDDVISSVPEKINFIDPGYCLAGQSWVWDGVTFEILHPNNPENFSGNNASCVLKVGLGRQSVLFTGDIEQEAEYSLLADNRNNLRASVLIAPHHGSSTSSSAGFIRAVLAKTIIISSGYLNRFRLPNQDIISKYHTSGAAIYDTATDGAITVKFIDGVFMVTGERVLSSKFWNFKK